MCDINVYKNALEACAFNNWYEKFKKISIPSIVINIPAEVVNYLREEMIILPKECNMNNCAEEVGYENDDTEEVDIPEFPEFSNTIAQSIIDLANFAFIKTKWHCPKDAAWITAGQTLKCRDITDVYQLLKASNIVKEDLCNETANAVRVNEPAAEDEQQTFESNKIKEDTANRASEYYLVLRKWIDVHPGTEFRCFVKDRVLIAISPRDWPEFHSHIVAQKLNIVSDIQTLFDEKIKNEFPLNNFVFDVVRSAKDNVILVDFSPFDRKCTAGLAFEWEELDNDITLSTNAETNGPEFRYLPSAIGIQTNNRRDIFVMPEDVRLLFGNCHEHVSNLDPQAYASLASLLHTESEKCQKKTTKKKN